MALCQDNPAAAAAQDDRQDLGAGPAEGPTLALVGSPDCGYSPSEPADAQLNAGGKGVPVSKEVRHALPKGFSLHEYRIEAVLGDGGFGITYLAEDVNLGKRVAIKEYLPGDLAIRQESEVLPKSTTSEEDFLWGLSEFLREAQTLAQFEHPNIVPVLRFFEANGTAYIVMAFQEGDSLFDVIVRKGSLDQKTLEKIVTPLLDGLEQVHNLGFLHRDIKPENIYIRSNGSPVLLDFGAARQALGTKTRTLTSIVSRGFAPFEQYTRTGKQGPWTDIYGLGAVLYMAITGDAPPDSTDRIETDQMEPIASVARGRYADSFLRAIDAALAVRADDRPQTLAEWRAMLFPSADAKAAPPVPRGGADTLRPGTAAGRAERPTPKRRISPSLVVGGLAALLLIGAGAAAFLTTGGSDPAAQQAESGQAEESAAAERPEQVAGPSESDAEAARRKAAEEEARREAQEADARRRLEEQAEREAEVKQKAETEAEARTRVEAETRANAEAEQRAKAAADAKRKTEAAERAKVEAEASAKAEAEQAATEAKRKAAAEAAAVAKAKKAADAKAKKAAADAKRKAQAEAAAQAGKQTQQAALPPAAAPSNSLREMFAGGTVYKKKAGHPQRDDVWQFRPDGTLKGSYSQPFTSQVTSPEIISDTGSWSVAGNKLCLQWRGWDGGKKICYAISGTGKNLVASGGGLMNGRFTLAK